MADRKAEHGSVDGLDVRGIGVVIDDRRIVEDISLRVAGGEVVGVVGPNGCGKTTLLKAVYKVLSPVNGQVTLNGMDVLRERPAVVARHLAVVSQFQQMDFDLTVEQMVGLGRAPYQRILESSGRKDRRMVQDALGAVGLSGAVHHSLHSLSGGERQRVALARAMVQDAEFMILDEPTNHLDVRHQLEVLDVVRDLGIGVLAALHDLHLAARFCDEVCVMAAGQLVARGRPSDVLTAELVSRIYDVDCVTYTDPRGYLDFSYARTGEKGGRR
ncbi:ABC transporter ATP-binding protein [uncultured Corynebacterium sp.]|uniref:ABC transporter ATP-binding protein n=1 Tax=uncultured Corynebacterium sp. TaxID=159447 RepID=UPI0025D8D649|nr:ABC transporter ATP-binding protein [uncultured Corynebacterium sp.]